MDAQQARKILGEPTDRGGGWVLFKGVGEYNLFHTKTKTLSLDGEYTADELEAFVYVMRNDG